MRIMSNDNLKEKTIKGHLDSGASGNFIDSNYASSISAKIKNLKNQSRSIMWMEHPTNEGPLHNVLIYILKYMDRSEERRVGKELSPYV